MSLILKSIARRAAAFGIFLFALHAALFAIFAVLPQSSSALLGWARDNRDFVGTVNRNLGITGTLGQRYWQHLRKTASLDLGQSSRGGFPVSAILSAGFLRSTPLYVASAVGMATGFIAALCLFVPQRKKNVTRVAVRLPVLLLFPPFVVAAFFYAAYSVAVSYIPNGGYDICYWAAMLAASAMFPFMLAFAAAQEPCREALRSDYLRTYVSLGFSAGRIRLRVARNVLLATRAQLARLAVASGLSCSFTELLFNLPGFGRAGLVAFRDSDFALIFGWALFVGVGAYLIDQVARWQNGAAATIS